MRAFTSPPAGRTQGAPPAVRSAAIRDRVVRELRAGIDPVEPEALFAEPLSGLHMREIAEPDVFCQYFSARAV
jgi:hypothetical protein